MKSARCFIFLVTAALLLIAGCETLKTSKPILPIKEYERMIVGRLDANYVGTRNCLSSCHYHDKIKTDFDASTMGAQLSAKSGLPLVDCESCHGPGSLAIEGLSAEKVEQDAKAGKQTACDYKTLIDLKSLPSQAQSLICLKCHSANATFNLHNWNASLHAIGEVSCFECHNVHIGPDLTVRREEMENMCEKCHLDVKAQFALPNHHPVHEKKIFCTSCHDPHGSINDRLLRKSTVKETCTQCHAEKEGPFSFEHADVNEDCRACHSPHGSVNSYLLNVRQPFLCLQCHEGHRATTSPTSLPSDVAETKDWKGTYYTRCTDCHSTIHGTDLPSHSGKGRLTR